MAGNRTVPVETGQTYLSAGSGTKLMSISEFISTFILLQNTQGGYLAQHQVIILCTKYFEEATSLSLFLVVSTSARVGERHHSSGLLRPIND